MSEYKLKTDGVHRQKTATKRSLSGIGSIAVIAAGRLYSGVRRSKPLPNALGIKSSAPIKRCSSVRSVSRNSKGHMRMGKVAYCGIDINGAPIWA